MDDQLLAKTFVELADNLVADFDLIDFLRLLTDRCVAVLGVSAAGVLLADRNGELRVMAASSEEARLLELFQLQNDEGPCLECFHTGTAVTVRDLSTQAGRWPRFVAQAQRTGFTAVQALPMRLRDDVVGALNLFSSGPGLSDPAAVPLGQALADVATISLLQQRSTQVSTLLNEQLQTALNSRVLIEQAKGKLAERLDIDMEQAFTALRGYARAHQRRLSDVALAFVNGTEPLTDLAR
jgi:transcriptional regulator with GAF, ATPase, and Fis domain